MADKIPVKAIFTAGNTTALGEFNPGDVVPIEFGGTGVDNLIDLKTSINLSGTNTGDQVLPTTLPASDVYSWAKAATKPSYSFSEITTLPTTISGFGITDSYTKVEIDTYLGNKQNTLTLGSIANNLLANSAVANLSGTNTGDQTSISGNAGTATKLQTARTIAGVSFDGSANISLTKSNVGLANVDNTSDINKPVSTAQQTALNLKANLASPALTGTPTAPTAVAGTNTTQLATTAFTQTAISNLVASSPAALDTLNELATALGNDPNFATTMTNALSLKANLASPTFTGNVANNGRFNHLIQNNGTFAAFVEEAIATATYADGVSRPAGLYSLNKFLNLYTNTLALKTTDKDGNFASRISIGNVGNVGVGKAPDDSGAMLQVNGGVECSSINGGQLAGFRNILINGDMRINQRSVTIAAAATGNYGPDRWKKVDASNMTQIVESGNFEVSTVYTLSGTGVTTQQITSPSSGNWTIPSIPITATKVQLEKGSIATPFENRPIGLELSLCQRYYEKSYALTDAPGTPGVSSPFWCRLQGSCAYASVTLNFATRKRATPIVYIYNPNTGTSGQLLVDSINVNGLAIGTETGLTFYVNNVVFTVNQALSGHWVAVAEL